MSSNIDASKPTAGVALTADVRSNFGIAASEISTLQDKVATLEANSGSSGGDTTDLEDRISALETTVADQQSKITTLETNVTDLQSQLTSLQGMVELLKLRKQGSAVLTTPNPPNTTSNVFIVGADLAFQQTDGSRVFVEAQGHLGNTQNIKTVEAQLIYGIGSPPAFGTPVSNTNGTLLSGVIQMITSRANDLVPFSAIALLENLELGEHYWFGCAFRTLDGGEATLSQMTLVAFSLIDIMDDAMIAELTQRNT